jgi:hypothetical protein
MPPKANRLVLHRFVEFINTASQNFALGLISLSAMSPCECE